MKTLLLPLFLSIFFFSCCRPSHALIVNTTGLTECSRTCEAKDCLFPPLLRYGKYCGIGYTGCEGEAPCDGLDACCQAHDACIGSNLDNYLNVTCNQRLLDCVLEFELSGKPQFPGAKCSKAAVCTTMELVMEIAVHLKHHH